LPPPRPDGPREIDIAVLEASPNAIVAVDARGRIVYANPKVETTFGHARTAIIGEPVEVLLPGRVGELHVAHRTTFLSDPVARPMGIGLDLAGRRRDGEEFPVEISLSPVETPDGLLVFATVVDITARKAAEHQLLQSQKLESVGRLAGGIAHDFNNMLFAIRGHGELLVEDLEAAVEDATRLDATDALQRVRIILDAADRAAALTSQLLAFSRQRFVTPTVIDIGDAIVAVEPMLRPLIGENIRLVTKLDPDVGRLLADPGHLDQILVNLAVNARDAMPSGGTITIETANAVFDEPYALEHFDVRPGRYVMLAVSDTGVGMDRTTREHVFEPFFTTKEPGKGTGLGLATIYGIVRQAGGHIWLYSEPGHGSTFKLYFPRVDAEPESRTTASKPAAVGSGAVLLVEDDEAVRSMTTELLRRSGFTVSVAVDGAAALEMFEAIRAGSPRFDVLITDVIMPGMSGLELGERLRERDPALAIVLLSGYTAETLDLAHATAEGAIFVGKPVTSRQLLDAVARARRARATDRGEGAEANGPSK
jgi:PAS domain S-box-containing protein